MDDFDNIGLMGERYEPNGKKRSQEDFSRDISLGHIKIEDSSFQETTSYSHRGSLRERIEARSGFNRGSLRERIEARSGFNASMLNTNDIFQSTCSNTSPDHATLLESPVFLPNELPSPTTGKLSSLPFDKHKDELFDGNTIPFSYQSISRSSHDPANIVLETDDSEGYEQILIGGDLMPSGAPPPDDGYNWRKYGQKLVKGSEFPRSYYKCTHPNCEVKKKVERSREGHVIEIIYAESHKHPKPPPNRRSGIGSSSTEPHIQIDGIKQEGFGGTSENMEWPSTELEYVSNSGSMQVHSGTRLGSGEAAAATFFRDDEEDDLWSHMSDSMSYDGQVDEPESKRRKLDAYAGENSGSTRTSREPKVVVLTTSDIDILNDGYRWRKYGQKVVKGNPNPRSYYKCTANGCLVTKHVERASDDFKNVLTTYIGKHNHAVPPARNSSNLISDSLVQGGLATQNQNHNVQYAMPYSRSEGLVTGTSSLFDFQPNLIPPSGFPYYIGQSEFSNLSAPDLTIGQEMLPSLPTPNNDDQASLTLPLAAQPNVEPVSQQELDLSASFLIYKDIVSRLPQM